MGSFCNTPSPPPAPNYAAAAQAQGDANLKAAQQGSYLSNPNVNSPYGNQSVTWNQVDPNDPNSRQATINQTLTPDAQSALTAQQRTQAALGGLAQQGIGQAQDILGHPFQFTGAPISTDAPTPGQMNSGPNPSYFEARSFDPQGYATDPTAFGRAQGVGAGMYGLANGQVDTSNVARMPVNAGTTGQQAILSRLQPQIEQNANALQNQLANQGITQGSEAWNNAMRAQGNQQNDLYQQAALQGINLDTQANQQGFNQALQSAGLYNSAVGQNFGQGVTAQQLTNQAIGQNFGQSLAANAQNYDQRAQTQAMANQSQAQNFGQYFNSAQFQNQNQNQAYNQSLQNANFSNNASQAALAQQLALYNQPLNQITALMSGSQIQNPQFQPFQGQNVQAAPVFQAAQAQANYGMDQYGLQMQSANANRAGLYQLGGAAAMAFSDERLKTNVQRVGTHPLGVGVYEYDIAGRRERGVMAQELLRVKPQAVFRHPSGFLMVDYGQLDDA